MKTIVTSTCCAAACLLLALSVHGATAPAAKSAKAKADKKTPEAAEQSKSPAAAVISIPKSVFTVPANPREGRNPFFPEPVEVKLASSAKSTVGTAHSALVLNGITGPPRRSAMVNGRTFEAGEKGEVKLKDGTRVPVECVEIKDESVVLLSGGHRVELKLRGGL